MLLFDSSLTKKAKLLVVHSLNDACKSRNLLIIKHIPIHLTSLYFIQELLIVFNSLGSQI